MTLHQHLNQVGPQQFLSNADKLKMITWTGIMRHHDIVWNMILLSKSASPLGTSRLRGWHCIWKQLTLWSIIFKAMRNPAYRVEPKTTNLPSAGLLELWHDIMQNTDISYDVVFCHNVIGTQKHPRRSILVIFWCHHVSYTSIWCPNWSQSGTITLSATSEARWRQKGLARAYNVNKNQFKSQDSQTYEGQGQEDTHDIVQ